MCIRDRLGTVKAQLFRAKEILFQMMQRPQAAAYFETVARRDKRVVAAR